jgi:hypothetical protein
LLVPIAIIGLAIATTSYIFPKPGVSPTPVVVAADSMGIAEKDGFTLSLDSLTSSGHIEYFQYLPSVTGHRKLSFLNPDIDAIYIYDLDSFHLEKLIRLTDYNFSHRRKIQGYYFINSDSLLVYSYADSRLTMLSLKKGILLTRTIADPLADPFTLVYPYVSGRTPIIMDSARNTVYFTGFSSDEGGTREEDKHRNVVASCNLSTGAVEYLCPYPEFYWGKNWGGAGGFRQSYMTFDPKRNRLVVSFMADHRLYSSDVVHTRFIPFYGGSRYFTDIHSMKYSPNVFDFLPNPSIYRYYLENPSYTLVKFDPYHDLYFRIAELPFTKGDPKGMYDKTGEILRKRKSMILLDTQLRKTGETPLSRGLDLEALFLTEEGVYIRDRSVKSDDQLVFKLITFQKKKSL